MRYKVGMYGGSFDPLHIGHIHDIIKGASMCEELYVMISWCKGRESTSKELRYRWILNSIKHLTNVKIMLVEDEAVSKDVYNTDYYWEKGATDIKELIGKKLDVVFCGSDYKGTGSFESLYGDDSEIVYFDRAEVPISSTEVRFDNMKVWEYIPHVAKSYYTKRILVLGGESTGKSTLVKNLALAYNTNYVSEVGRDTCEYAGGEEFMVAEDLIENLIKQKVNVEEASKNSNRLLFVDTDALTTKFYIDFLLDKHSEESDKCHRLAEAIHNTNKWDLVLFLEPTVEFVQDGTRSEEIASNRLLYSNKIKEIIDKYNVNYITINGDYTERFNESRRIIKDKLGVDTKW